MSRLDSACRYKGIDVLIQSMPNIVNAVKDAHLVVVGDGSDRHYLEELAKSYGVDSRTRFSGSISDEALAHEYSRAQIFALPARTTLAPTPEGEGFGIVLLEAAAAGLPIVTANEGAVLELVDHGINGLAVDPRDPTTVGDAIITLLGSPTLCEYLGGNGLRLAKYFAPDGFDRRLRKACLDAMRT